METLGSTKEKAQERIYGELEGLVRSKGGYHYIVGYRSTPKLELGPSLRTRLTRIYSHRI